ADCRTKERFDFGLRRTRPAQRPEQRARHKSARENRLPTRNGPRSRAWSSRSKASAKRRSALLAVSALMFMNWVILVRIGVNDTANSERCSHVASVHRNFNARARSGSV